MSVLRLVLAPILLLASAYGSREILSVMLITGFLTDVVDGWLARKWQVSSPRGAYLDGIADDVFVFFAALTVYIADPLFVRVHVLVIGSVFLLIIMQNVIVLARFGKRSSFHTYLGKTGFFLQAVYIIQFFVLGRHQAWLFYLTMFVTLVSLLEEIIISLFLKELQTDVKGLPWIRKKVV